MANEERGRNGLIWQVTNHEKRITSLEATNVAVLADRLNRLSGQVTWMIASFAGLILTILGGIIVFLVTQSTP
jgi:hypothetical protein